MRFLLDTHILLWASGPTRRLSQAAAALLGDPQNELYFSVANLWEIAIKHGLKRDDFKVEPRTLRHGLLENGYRELTIVSDHAFAVGFLPPIHKDPFDRLLIAQSTVEAITLLTADPIVAQYPGPIRLI